MGNIVNKYSMRRRRRRRALSHQLRIPVEEDNCETQPIFSLLNEEFSVHPGAYKIRNTIAFLKNPHQADAGENCCIHYMTDHTNIDSIPPGRFPVPVNVEVPLHGRYPLWLVNYINREGGMKLKLEMMYLSMPPRYTQSIPEARHLRESLKYLLFTYNQQPDETALPDISLQEIHKGKQEKGLKIRKHRSMYPRFILMKKTAHFIIMGKGFMLRLFPVPDRATREQFNHWENNGEMPVSIGTYTRVLDTVPNMSMEWSVRLWGWENMARTLMHRL